MNLPAIIEIDLDALARNYARVVSAANPSTCGAVVKANAYGLGLEPVTTRLYNEGCRDYFVATLDEAIALRRLLPNAHIYVLEGLTEASPEEFAKESLVPVLNSVEQVTRWIGSRQPVVIHLDTGMNRLGLSSTDLRLLSARKEFSEGLTLAYVMTHLACADEPDHALNRTQLELFEEMRSHLPNAPTSIGNSAGAFLSAEHRGDLVRPGIALYGGNPFLDRESPVEPVVSLRAPVIQIITIDQSSTVGYGASFVAEPGSRIAVVGLGYADGYPRSLSNNGIASVAGVRVPVVGRVSMDLLCLDVSGVPEHDVAEGTYVELFGNEISIDEVALAAGTISNELLTGLGSRIERRYAQD